MSAGDTESSPSEAQVNISTQHNQKLGWSIILTAFGIIGALAGFSIYTPDNALKVETIVTASISGLFGFIAGRKS